MANAVCRQFAAPPIIPDGVTAVYLSFGDPQLRRVDFCCNDGFSDYLALELVPWIQATIGHQAQLTLCGLSLSGLAAIHAAFTCQSFRPGDQPVTIGLVERRVAFPEPARGPGPDVRVSVGAHETSENVGHGHPDLFQVTSQVDSCRNLVAGLQRQGHSVEYVELKSRAGTMLNLGWRIFAPVSRQSHLGTSPGPGQGLPTQYLLHERCPVFRRPESLGFSAGHTWCVGWAGLEPATAGL